MQLRRNEVLTGLLVLGTLAVLTGILILLGAPGLFKSLVTYKIYFDNASGIKQGAPVLLAGRKIGQVVKLSSPVTDEEAARALQAANAPRTDKGKAEKERVEKGETQKAANDVLEKKEIEVRIDVQVDEDSQVFRDAIPRLVTLGLLGETAIDFSAGNQSAGLATDGEIFLGERVPDFGEAIAGMLDIIKPVATEATATLKELQVTAQNFSKITDETSQLNMAIAQFRTFAENLTNLTARDSSLSLALKNVEEISASLTADDNLKVTLQNFRDSSEKLKNAMDDLGPDLRQTGRNVADLTDTVKRQPWRLVWPSTKSYPDDGPDAATEISAPSRLRARGRADETITVRKTARRPSASPTPSARGGRFLETP